MSAALTQSTTILVVDDNRPLLDFVCDVLGMAGYHVLAADCGRNAIETYETCGLPVHLLLTDVIMPDLTGPVIAERLRQRQPDLQVLFISGYHDADLLQRFITQKGFALLPKPFTTDALLRGVEDALRRSAYAA
jgi:two-component system cell cycle sensor histidine kinase/response regulator CckA